MQFFDKVLKKMNFVINIGFISLMLLTCLNTLSSQLPNYSTWHFKDGNYQASKRGNSGFHIQSIDSFIVKWATPDISGDVTPLIGNIVSNPINGISEAEPLELIALMGDEMVIISGEGKLIKKQKLPAYAQNVKDLTVLFDSLETGFSDYSNSTVLIASESIEFFNPNSKDTLAHSYIFGFDTELDSIKVVKRLSIDLREYKPNVSASIKPFYGRQVNGRMMVYALIDMNKPILNGADEDLPYFRGYAQFFDDGEGAVFPLPDVRDQKDQRLHLAGDVGLYQPSLSVSNGVNARVILPWQAADIESDSTFRTFSITDNVGTSDYLTYADSNYVVGFDINGNRITSGFTPVNFTPSGNRPILRPIIAELTNSLNNKNDYIILAEQYSGIDGSEGVSRIHLYNSAGEPVTQLPTSKIPPLTGGANQYWSIGVGNVDGVSTNAWNRFFPNNPGNEIIVTQSTKESVYPESKLHILRFHTGLPIEKPTPAGDTLFPFDTIATSAVNGWLAAVGDIDLQPDGKDEMILVDGSKLMVLRMRDYSDINFRLGYPFDTVFVREFSKQTIASVALADMEGDGRPDLVVTTFDSTYIIGMMIENTIIVKCPEKDGISSFCFNDTIQLSWENKIISQPRVRIEFEITDETGSPLDTVIISESASNDGELMTRNILADDRFFIDNSMKRSNGRFIIKGLVYPDKLTAKSCMIEINKPSVNLTSVFPDSIMTGEAVAISADIICVDSVALYFKTEGMSDWQYSNLIIPQAGEISTQFEVPCMSGLFSCSDNSSYRPEIEFMLIFQKNGFIDSVNAGSIKVKPNYFNFTIDEKLTADPSLHVRWNSMDLFDEYPCDEVSISLSADNGASFNQIGLVNSSEGYFKWNVPIDIQDSQILRVCCNNLSCLRTDTLINGLKPLYVNIIAPNPFNPDREELEFVYSVPENMNINVTILDQSNRIVRNLLKDVPRSGNIVYTDIWDGRKDNGSVAANGLYYLVLDLSNGNREVHQIFVGK